MWTRPAGPTCSHLGCCGQCKLWAVVSRGSHCDCQKAYSVFPFLLISAVKKPACFHLYFIADTRAYVLIWQCVHVTGFQMSWEQAAHALHRTPPVSVCAWMSSVPWVWVRSSSSSGIACSSLGWVAATRIQTHGRAHWDLTSWVCMYACDSQSALLVHAPACVPAFAPAFAFASAPASAPAFAHAFGPTLAFAPAFALASALGPAFAPALALALALAPAFTPHRHSLHTAWLGVCTQVYGSTCALPACVNGSVFWCQLLSHTLSQSTCMSSKIAHV